MKQTPSEVMRNSREDARRAAKEAAGDFLQRHRTPSNSRSDRVAVYTWAGLAVVSAVVATTAGLSPGLQSGGSNVGEDLVAERIQPSDTLNTSDKIIVAEAPVTARPAEKTSPATLSPLETPAPETVVSIPDQVATLDDPGIDTTTTGSVTAAKPPKTTTPLPVPALALGVDIGRSTSIPALRARFLALQNRAPDLFSALTPLANLRERNGNLEARLIAGPFATPKQVSEFCRAVKLQLTVDCKQSIYQGDPIEFDG